MGLTRRASSSPVAKNFFQSSNDWNHQKFSDFANGDLEKTPWNARILKNMTPSSHPRQSVLVYISHLAFFREGACWWKGRKKSRLLWTLSTTFPATDNPDGGCMMGSRWQKRRTLSMPSYGHRNRMWVIPHFLHISILTGISGVPDGPSNLVEAWIFWRKEKGQESSLNISTI